MMFRPNKTELIKSHSSVAELSRSDKSLVLRSLKSLKAEKSHFDKDSFKNSSLRYRLEEAKQNNGKGLFI